jgi:hypothetical protein
MNPTAKESDTGITVTNVLGPINDQYCFGVHRAFLKSHKLQKWTLNIIGNERREIVVTSTAPDGLPTTKTIPLHLAFPDDLRAFLEEEFKKYTARENRISGD